LNFVSALHSDVLLHVLVFTLLYGLTLF